MEAGGTSGWHGIPARGKRGGQADSGECLGDCDDGRVCVCVFKYISIYIYIEIYIYICTYIHMHIYIDACTQVHSAESYCTLVAATNTGDCLRLVV